MLKLSLFALKAFAAFWSLVTFAVAGAMIAKFNDYARGYIGGSGFSSGNAVVAAGVITFIYLLASLALFMLRNRSIAASIMVETICLGFLWILLLGSVAALSADSPAFRNCYRNSFCALGNASIALGWILWLMISIILFTQVYYTYRHFGGSLDTWRTPVYDLLDHNGPSDRGITATGGLGGGATTFPAASSGTATGAVPMTQTHQHQQPMQAAVAPQPKVETSAV